MVVKETLYIPRRGDIVYLNFNPTMGHEQRGERPTLVLSPVEYNRVSALALFMPITSPRKGYPFEVPLPSGLATYGVVLVDQVKSLDWKVRQVRFVEIAPKDVIEEVQAKIETLLW